MRLILAFCALIVTVVGADEPLLLQKPTLSKTQIVFAYAGDLWSVSRDGGAAVRLTSGTGVETDPAFSPDGRRSAFTGEYDGNAEGLRCPSSGGVPKRLNMDKGFPGGLIGNRLSVGRHGCLVSGGQGQLFFDTSVGGHGEHLAETRVGGPVQGDLPELRSLTNTPGVMERDPQWSPDGKSIAYLSDESGEYALHIRPQNGGGEVKKFALKPGFLPFTEIFSGQ